MEEGQTSAPLVYVNSVNFTMGSYELLLSLGWQDPEGQRREFSRVVMSWPHAKKTLEVLKTHVEIYEHMFGIIATEPNPEARRELEQSGTVSTAKVTGDDDD